MYKGPSGFAIMNRRFPVRRFLSQYPEGMKRPYLPVLYRYFGRSWKGIEMWLEEFWEERKLLQFHLCFRNPDPRMAEYAAQIDKKLRDINAPYLRTFICPILEDKCSDDEWKKWAKKVRQAVDTRKYSLVRSSLNTRIEGGRLEERHGKYPRFTSKPPRKCIANPDGCSVDFGDNERYLYNLSDRDRYIMTVRQAKNYLERAKQRKYRAAAIWCAYQQGLQNTPTWGGPPVCERDFVVTDEAQHYNRILFA